MSYKYNCNQKYDYIKKNPRKGRIVGSEKRKQNCVGKSCENVKSNEF